MSPNKLNQFLLLAYLVLLLSCGRSLHHAEMLGLHRSGDSPADSSTSSHSCCCHAVVCTESGVADEFSQRPDDAASDHCLFCDFFDDYRVVVGSLLFELSQEPHCYAAGDQPLCRETGSIPPVARGPPIA